jgi:hypothetical protein
LKQKITMKKTTKKIAAPVPAPAPKAPKAAKAPARKPAAPAKKKTGEPPVTFISAQIDIGFGNHLYLRGSGPGLSWDKGIAMDCVGSNLWTASIRNATAPVVFKVLVNDLSWNTGDDYVVAAGQSITVTPSF